MMRDQQIRRSRLPESSQANVHLGEVIWHIADTYPSLMLTVVEGIQNGIDAEAMHVFVGIDLRNRTVVIADDGNGVSKQDFDRALGTIGRTIKSKDKLGRFGRGLIAPLDKCTRFTFASCPIGSSRTLVWTFTGSEIRKQSSGLEIPVSRKYDTPKLPRNFVRFADDEFECTWRTMVTFSGVTKDKVVSVVDLDILESEVRQKLGTRMRERGVTVRAALIDQSGRESWRDIEPLNFRGEPIEVVTYVDSEAGEVEFELYRAPRRAGVRKGEVIVSQTGDSYGVPMLNLVRQAHSSSWGKDFDHAFSALTSGYFEGVIRCKNIELHAERTRFVFNDALQALYFVLDQWFSECGKGYFEDEQVVSREARWRDLGVQSQQRLRDILLNRPEYQRLWDGLKQAVKQGRVGEGHLDPESGRPGKLDDETSVRSGQGGAGTGRTKGTGGHPSTGPRQRDPQERPGDIPTGVIGPRGQRRQLVRGDSEGLWFEYSWLEGSSHLWEFDFNSGILTFNVRHPQWVKLDETNGKHTPRNAKFIMALQEWLALQVLTLVRRYDTTEELELHRDFVDDQVGPYIDLFIMR